MFGALRTALAYLVLPNLVFWIAGAELEILPRATVNLDYLAVAVVAPFVSVGIAVSLMSMALTADVFRCSGSIYYFSQRDALSALVFVRELPMARVAGIACLLIVSVIGCSWSLVRIGGRDIGMRSRALWVGLLTLTFGVVGVWGGNSSLRFRDNAATSNICTSAGVSMLKTAITGLIRKHDGVAPVSVDSATRRAGWLDAEPRSHNLVLVILESGGTPMDPKWRELLAEPFTSAAIRSRYDVETGVVPFGGATVPGEYRELCNVTSGITESPPVKILNSCLPYRARQNGFETIYLHGFNSAIFRRAGAVPRLGFEKNKFHQDFRSEGLRDCGGPFRGTCDEEIAGWIGDYLVRDSERRHFVDFLTLNSHLPVAADQDSSAILGCGTQDSQVSDEAACNLLGLVIRAERAIAKVAVRPDLPETEFVIVGDHAPPFIQRTRRETFSQQEVSYFHLKPKKLKGSPKVQ
jgi:hypothetical protein